MNNEIKEILELNNGKHEVYLPKEVIEAFRGIDYELSVCSDELPKILDCITDLKEEVNKLTAESTECESRCYKLQEELEDLRESDWAWHQLLKTQNKRMYRSKFLKDFQKEYGTNTYPDYDEIYKRYDKMKSKNEKAIEYCRLNKEFTPRLEDVENILQGSDKE